MDVLKLYLVLFDLEFGIAFIATLNRMVHDLLVCELRPQQNKENFVKFNGKMKVGNKHYVYYIHLVGGTITVFILHCVASICKCLRMYFK